MHRVWEESFDAFATVYPMASTQTPQEDGLEPVNQVRIMFCVPKGQEVTAGDRVTVEGATYEVTEATVYYGFANLVAVRL